MSSHGKLRPYREGRAPKKPEGILRRSSSSRLDSDSQSRSRSTTPNTRGTSPTRAPSSPTRSHQPSSPPSPNVPIPSPKVSSPGDARRWGPSYPDRSDTDMASERFTNQLMEIEERFNREMEQSRRRDLEKKHELREHHLEHRIRTLEDLLAASNQKGAILVQLMTERERQLQESFVEQLDRTKRSAKTVRMEDDHQELLHLRAALKNLQQENDHLLEESVRQREQLLQQGRKPPLFGVEIEDMAGDEVGVRIATVTGPAAAAGMKPNDVIQQLTVTLPVRSRVDFHHAMSKFDVGDRVSFVLARANGEKEVVPVVAGGMGRILARGMENLSYGGGSVESVTRSSVSRDDISLASSLGMRNYVRRVVEDPMPELRTYYKPSDRVDKPPERVRHVALDGTVSYVPLADIIHTPTASAAPSPLNTRSAYVAGPPVVARGRSPHRSPVQHAALTPDRTEMRAVRQMDSPA
eukprot:GGOE01004936.1.p1 GENE.GGOE01004936.1~~GGOE01004936.1.p1  ORF type:complete len:467 (-),score=102.76 GGOE01004936.1:530-1930(-)